MIKLPNPTADTPTLSELKNYLNNIDKNITPTWGKMTGPEMLRHCRNFIEMYLGNIHVSMIVKILARLFGQVFLKKVLNGSPTETPKNLNTINTIKVTETSLDFENERSLLINSLSKVESLEGIYDHPLYGKMESKDVVALIRHHTAHHFNQFGILSKATN